MLYEVLRYIRNFFPVEGGYHDGAFEISNGTINLPFLKDGQYFLIEDSVFNDGVHQYPAYGLQDEIFNGSITAMRIPKDFLMLVEEIETWQNKYGDNNTPFASESFEGVYSYTKGTSGSGAGGTVTWKDAFANRLKVWRKV